jgi:hypothetical protein
MKRARRYRLRRGRVRERRYLAWCATQPCCVTGELPATTHHVRKCRGKYLDLSAPRFPEEQRFQHQL